MPHDETILEKLAERLGSASREQRGSIDEGLFELLDEQLDVIGGGLAYLNEYSNQYMNNHTNNHNSQP